MMRIPAIKGRKDFWAGVLYIAFGATGWLVGRNYSMGTANHMGPGYFPVLLSALLTAIGLICVIRSFVAQGGLPSTLKLKPVLLVIGSLLLCGYLLPRAGLVAALAVSMFTAFVASEKFRAEWKNLLILAFGTIVFSAVVFVRLLGISLPLLGSWFS